jgi:hypothetical protein
MRSQVQVLAGPPPIPAGQSAVGSELGAFAGCLGRAGAARPSPPARPSALPGPSTRAAASTTTTHRGRPTITRTAATRQARQPRAAACSRALAQPPATGRSARRPGLPGRPGSSGGHRPHRPGRVRHQQPRRPCATPARQPIGTSTRSRGAGCLAASACPQTPRLMGTRRTRPDGRGGHRTAGHRTAGHRTAGHRTAGRWTGGQQMAGPPDPGRRTQVTGHRTGRTPDGPDTGRGGHRTAGSRTTGPMGGHRMLDAAGDRRHCWRPGIVDHGDGACPLDAPLGRRVWASNKPGQLSSKDYEGHHAPTDGA